jgi:lipopolysaccharide export system permease protein
MMMIAFAALGTAQTTRQGRGLAVALAVVAVVALRIAGFAASSVTVRSPWGIAAVYGAPVGTIVIALVIILRGSALRGLFAHPRAWIGRPGARVRHLRGA